MLQPTRVLPSNAPPLQDGSDGLHQSSRVLQEHSGNRQQHHDFGSTGDWDQTKYLYDQQKYPANVLTGENAYARHHVPQQQHQHRPQHLYHPQPQHRYAWRHGYRGPYGQIDEARVQYDAERLYQRFRGRDQYVKYRTRQAKEDKGHGDQKWPEHLEKAFFRALITYPPMGRRKQLHKEKQRGRNELIADCIEELTGEARTRKQVSSHIQVLKPFVDDDPAIMKWLSKDDMFAHVSRIHGYPTGRRMSNYPVAAPPHSMRAAMPSLPRTDAYGLQQLKQSPQAFEPADFQMFIQRKYKDVGKEEKIDRLHTYSQAVSHPLAEDHPMPDWPTLARDFPQLAEANAQRPLDCTVLIAEASLAFPTEPMEKWKDREGASIELGICFQCRSRQLPAPRPGMKSTVSLLNKFYDRGVEVKDYSETTEVYFHNVPETTGTAVETEIKFGSKFWARTLGHVGNKMRDPMELTQQQRDELTDYVRSLSALQEVFIATDRGPERIMIIHWNFRLSSGKCGRASWRRLILPDSSSSSSSSTTGIYTAPQHQKTERADSFYDYSNSLGGDLTDAHSSHQTHSQMPTLQSPFEYDNSTSSGSGSGSANSALSSATWPTTALSDGSGAIGTIAGDFGGASADNSFDFNAGNINIAYDFDPFDSSAFNFDDGADVDFAADPGLGDFSQAVGVGSGWYDGAFDTGAAAQGLGVHVGGESASFAAQPDLDGGASQIYGGFDAGHYGDGGSQATFPAPATAAPPQPQHDYHSQHDQQAYGGAGPELFKEEDPLAALADASVWARGMGGTK